MLECLKSLSYCAPMQHVLAIYVLMGEWSWALTFGLAKGAHKKEDQAI